MPDRITWPNGWGLWGSTIRSFSCLQSRFSTISLKTDPVYGKGLRGLSIATAITLAAATALIFFYAPLDADQGVIQKIFYVHVPLAIVALCGFVAGGRMAIQHLRTGDRAWDLRSYGAIPLPLVFRGGGLGPRSRSGKRCWG